MWKHKWLGATCVIALIYLAPAISLRAQSFTTLHSFDGTDGLNPASGVVQGADANFYGTTVQGGTANLGTIFEMTPTGTLTTLQSFRGTNSAPNGLVLGTDRKFYGTTSTTVYSIVPGGTAVVLASVSGSQAPLVQGTDGNFYGTTAGGQPNSCAINCGTIFKITPTGSLTTLYTFDGSGGYSPGAALVQGTDGSFYGTTAYGGNMNCGLDQPLSCGTIFKMTPAGTLTSLYSFCEQTNCPDGFGPSGLIQASDGNFYGTTSGGGGNQGGYPFGGGTVFKINATTGTLTTLHVFNVTDGDLPDFGVIEGSDGSFYGTTQAGGASSACTNSSGCGTVFKMTPAGTVITLHAFVGTDGLYPNALTIATSGVIYGTTSAGGANLDGTVFSLAIGMGGTNPSNTSLNLSPSSIAVGLSGPVAMTAIVAPTSGSGTPSGVVDFFDGLNEIGVADLSGGVATFNYNPSSLAAGTYQITAIYSGDGTFTTSTSSTETLTISSSPPIATPSFSPASGTYTSAQSVIIIDTISGAAIYYTTDGTTPTTDSAMYSAPIAVDSSETIRAIAAATGYSNSAVATATYTITLSPDYQLTVKPSTLTIVAGQSGTATFTVTPANGFDSQVNFACSGLPAEATCAFNPLSVSPSDGTPVTGTLTITTTAASAALRTPPPTSLRLFYAFMIPGLGIVFGVAARHKLSLRGSTVLGTFAVLLLLGTLISCGSNSTTTTTPNSGTPPGTNSVTVKASTGGSGAVSHNAMLTITITQ